MSQWLKQSTTVTVKLGPFLDKTDAVTEETGLTLTVKLSKNGGAIANRTSATAITHDTLGYYAVELDATDTNTLGRLRVLAHDATNALPVWQDFMVIASQVWDSLFGADKLQVHVDEITAGLITAAAIGTDAITAAKMAADAVAEIADAIWDEARAGHIAAGSFGEGVAAVKGNVDGSTASVTAAVLVSAGTGAGQVDLTSGRVKVQVGTSAGQLDTDSGRVKVQPGTGIGQVDLTSGAVKLASPQGIKKNTALAGFPFELYTDAGALATGVTSITAERSLDGAAFGACANTPTEIGGGSYKIDLAAGDLNGEVVKLRFSKASHKTTLVTIRTVSP